MSVTKKAKKTQPANFVVTCRKESKKFLCYEDEKCHDLDVADFEDGYDNDDVIDCEGVFTSFEKAVTYILCDMFTNDSFVNDDTVFGKYFDKFLIEQDKSLQGIEDDDELKLSDYDMASLVNYKFVRSILGENPITKARVKSWQSMVDDFRQDEWIPFDEKDILSLFEFTRHGSLMGDFRFDPDYEVFEVSWIDREIDPDVEPSYQTLKTYRIHSNVEKNPSNEASRWDLDQRITRSIFNAVGGDKRKAFDMMDTIADSMLS
jgi:hypothetical protein